MDDNPSYTWLDLAAHDHLIDDRFIQADRYEDFHRFLRERDDEPEDLQEKA